ncbi:MOSC domain-containing protein [Fontimonas sp. SYSU GA230001]|uniref:MOSC domain-containing protein n=1 Tax=Fontimonas sp. SYSU GA230001 TaxID=3142450 RepID=UPI0032B4D14A
MQLGAIHVFPLKSGAALALDVARVERRGLAHDRRWMVVDAQGAFITGRQEPRLVLIRAQPQADGLLLSAPGMPDLLARSVSSREQVTVWRDRVDARTASGEASAWLSRFLDRECRLVFMDEAARRPVDPAYAAAGDEVSFADGFPLLLISEGSLAALNARLDAPVPMLRFRPNLVVAGAEPHAEDGWQRIRIGAIEFDVAKPCARCGFTTVMPDTGTLDPRGEPLRTLATYRRGPKGVMFGQNLLARGDGMLRVGDTVTVLSSRR